MLVENEFIWSLLCSIKKNYADLAIVDEMSDMVLSALKDCGPVEVVWIRAEKDQAFIFWKLLKEGLLAGECHVIFTDIEDGPCWGELARIYEGVKFGSTFLLVCDNANTSPPVVPGQKGLFRGEG